MPNDSDIGVPASFQAAWGKRQQSTKGPRPGLSLERIVEAAVQVASDDSLEMVSMSRVAADLGASTMSLYRYVASKDELLALMTDAVYGPAVAAQAPGRPWRAQLSAWAWANLSVLRGNPWVLRVPVSGYPLTPNQIAVLENGLSSLRDTKLTESEKLSVVMLLTSMVRIHVTLAGAVTEGFIDSGVTEEQGTSEYGKTLAQLADAERFPSLHAVIEAGVFEKQDHPDVDFEFILERVLDGVETLVAARAAEPKPTRPDAYSQPVGK
jgi:AcrR family transcriptional regulator